MKIKQSEKEITISQEGYITGLLKKHGMSNCKSVVTPIVLGQAKESNPSDDVIESKNYQELSRNNLKKLLYLNNRSRPDITFATSYLPSQFNTRPERRHYVMTKRILHYLIDTL